MEFNKEYFEEIWPGIGAKRFDYAPYLANQIVKKVGKCRILDVGCSGGTLVKELRNLGFEAFGIDISSHAISESYCLEYCFLGKADKLPFPSDSFDLIFSNGLLEYIKKENLEKVFNEFKRVGKSQWHRIDFSNDFWSKDFFISENLEWWKAQFKKHNMPNLEWELQEICPKILIATPVSDEKEYVFQDWINHVKALDWPNKEYLVIDNSKNMDFYNKYKNQINIVHVNLQKDMHFNRKIAFCMELIREEFIKSNAKYYFNLEADCLPEPKTLKFLVEQAENYNSDWTSANYPSRQNPKFMMMGFGATLFSKRIMQESFLGCPNDNTSTDGWYWNQKILPSPNNYRTLESWRILDIKHE